MTFLDFVKVAGSTAMGYGIATMDWRFICIGFYFQLISVEMAVRRRSL